MIVKWTTVKPVLARVTRNIRNVDADYMADMPEWIAEGIFKLKTHYQLQLKEGEVELCFHLGKLPCNIEALAAVTYMGMRMLPGDPAGPIRKYNPTEEAYYSVLKFPNTVQDIDETDINNLPFYLATVEELSSMRVDNSLKYRINYNKIECSLETGCIKVWYWSVPTDENNFPMIPDNENYHTALYWYCRMMLIGAGYEDKVFSFEDCEFRWKEYAARAIAEITYPTVDEKQRNIINNTGLIPHQYDWETFGGGGPEQVFNDDLT